MFNERAIYQLRQLQQALRAAVDEALKEIGLTATQYAILTALEIMPHSSGAAIARAGAVTAQSVNEVIQGLVKAQLVTRQAHPQHGRIVLLTLTEEGYSRLRQAHLYVEAVEAQMLDGLDKTQQAQFLSWLQQCRKSLGG